MFLICSYGDDSLAAMSEDFPPPAAPIKGRGARTNASGRYEKERRAAFDDGWPQDEAQPRPQTVAQTDKARTIISRNQSPDISFDRSINTYRGCEHGCFYCYARPNHAYAGLSPGLDFETRLFVKADAAALLEQELRKPGYRPAPIALGGVTDVYQPIERRYAVTRAVLETLARFLHPFTIVTKSQLVLRDLDIIAPMAARNLAKVAISVTSLDASLSRRMEPRDAAPHRRIETIRMLSAAGVPVTVMVAPVIPTLNDPELERILEAAAGAGALGAGYVVLRLPLEIKELAREWFEAHAPDRARRILRILQDMRGGKDYDARWWMRQRGEGPFARLIADRFHRACRRLGLDAARTLALDVTQFRPPPRSGDQLDLLC
ncbi:MAG: PA0069 family radical SAM protein [Hydrogenophilaceae bacterium]|nr:PA0069 family radical SAM protein [Hydrogenophilaceae bacterium]